jgi:uncharacterized protein
VSDGQLGRRYSGVEKPFHIMVKPNGPICNLGCTYCYYLEKEHLYPQGQAFRMSGEVLDSFVRQYISAQDVPEVNFAWQGGEPTLLGLEFFRDVVRLQEKYSNGKRISNAIQTNGTVLDDAWCEFFTEHRFLIGLSVDGPEELHDAYRVDKGGKPTFQKVLRGLGFLQKHGTQYNTLTVVNRANSQRPLEVYRFLKEIGSEYFQFIPLVEREPDADALAMGLDLSGPPMSATLANSSGTAAQRHGAPGTGDLSKAPLVTPWSVEPRQFGEFLVAIFEEWVRTDVGRIFVQLFDTALAGWVGMEPPLCVFAETCGNALALEHNGDLYACDHYVYPDFRLGNIMDTPLEELVHLPEQVRFGDAKWEDLPQFCRDCRVRFVCHGECPKHRFVPTPDGEPGLNYLCAGYKRFFTHIAPRMTLMAELLRRRRPPAEVMSIIAAEERAKAMEGAGRNDPCPCGSGKKLKNCCGTPA